MIVCRGGGGEREPRTEVRGEIGVSAVFDVSGKDVRKLMVVKQLRLNLKH